MSELSEEFVSTGILLKVLVLNTHFSILLQHLFNIRSKNYVELIKLIEDVLKQI